MTTRRNVRAGAQTLATVAPVQKVVRHTTAQAAIGVTDAGAALTFGPSAITGWTDYSTVYDLYRIKRVTVRFVLPRAAAPATTGDVFPTLLTAVDFNDSTAPASAVELLRYYNVRVDQFHEGRREYSVTLTPRLQFTTGGGANTVAAGDAAWARTSYNDVWFGLKYWLRYYNTTSFNNTLVDVYVKYEVEFKQSK